MQSGTKTLAAAIALIIKLLSISYMPNVIIAFIIIFLNIIHVVKVPATPLKSIQQSVGMGSVSS